MTEIKGHNVSDLTGRRFGRLTALYPTERRDKKLSVYWHCRCDCGNETEVTADGLVHGNYKSCGCLRRERQQNLHKQLHLVDGTCLEILEHRKTRSDNTSGFRGVNRLKNGKYRVSIGFKGKRFHLGVYNTYEEAVSVRLAAEKQIHGGFVEAYSLWEKKAEADPQWGKEHPCIFEVEKTKNNQVHIRTNMNE